MFRTELPLTPHPQQLPPSARVLTIGSCFSDTIGSRLTEFKVATMVNPFGTVFNPISACKLLRAAAGEDMDWQQHLVEARGRWQNHDLHAELGADTPVELLQRIQTMTREAGVFLATADVVVLTLGSAFAYRLRETEEIISNCHKIPAEKFDKELLTADDIIAAVAETHAYLRRINPRLRFILTVSPVRHVKDTLVLNSASKAMLRVACHYLSELLPDVTYFPAYELLMDDLRDYRFYASDMLHPSEVAENYVWERFTRTYFDATFGRFKKEWEGIRQSLNHRPLYPAAPEHREFLEATLERLRKVATQADVRMELLHVERELANLPLPVVPAAPEPEDDDDGEERIDIGSFDDEPAVAAKPMAAPAPTPAATPQPASAERQHVRAPEPREDSDDDATDRGQARILRPGFGVLLEDEDEELYDDNEAPAAISAPAATLVTPESAYDQAYSAAALAESEQDDSEEGTEGEPERRKKRRSRGGAKRTKRKNARLAAEQTAGELQPESSVVAVLPAPDTRAAVDTPTEQVGEEPAAEVVYVTEEELRRPRRSREADQAPTPAATNEEAATSEATPVSAEALTTDEAPASGEGTGNRRSRNNRRSGKREGADRSGNRSARQPLYAAEAEAAPAAAPEPTTAEVASEPVSASAPTMEEAAPAPAKEKPAPKRRSSTKTSAAKTTQTASAEASAAETTSAAAPAAPEVAQSAPEVSAPSAKKPTRRKPAAKPEPAAAAPVAATPTPTPAQPVSALEPATATPTKAPARKRGATKAKPAAASEAPAAVTAAEPATPAAVAAPAATTKAAARPKAATRAKPAAKAPANADASAAAPVPMPPAETPAAKPAAKTSSKARKATPAAQPATPEPVAKKPAAKNPAAKKPAAKKSAAKKAAPKPPASENN